MVVFACHAMGSGGCLRHVNKYACVSGNSWNHSTKIINKFWSVLYTTSGNEDFSTVTHGYCYPNLRLKRRQTSKKPSCSSWLARFLTTSSWLCFSLLLEEMIIVTVKSANARSPTAKIVHWIVQNFQETLHGIDFIFIGEAKQWVNLLQSTWRTCLNTVTSETTWTNPSEIQTGVWVKKVSPIKR